MKHLFIINPVSGGKKHNPSVTEEMIKKAMNCTSEPYEIYYTVSPKDACRKITAEAESEDDLRVYGCGGDGTLNECVNAAVGKENVAITQFPCGTGNDFLRMFGEDMEKFKNFKGLVSGKKHKIDVIKCGDEDYGVNICSVGIDARIGTGVHKYSRIPLLGGKAAYVTSLIANVLQGINSRMTIEVNGEVKTDMFALVCACNGRYYGGGFNPLKDARIDDGIIDILIVDKVSLGLLVRLIGKYATGRYYEIPDHIKRVAAGKIRISSQEQFVVNIDGEAVFTDDITLQIVPGGLNFIVPDGVNYFEEESKKEKTEA